MTQFHDRLDSFSVAGGAFEGADEHVERVERCQLPGHLEDRIASVDVDSFVSGVEKLPSYHLAARGSK